MTDQSIADATAGSGRVSDSTWLPVVRAGIAIVVVALVLAGAAVRMWNHEAWSGVDSTALLYLGAALLVVYLPRLPDLLKAYKTIKVTKEGVTLEQFEQVREVAKEALAKSNAAQAKAQFTRRVVTERLAGPTLVSRTSRRTRSLSNQGQEMSGTEAASPDPADLQRGKWGGQSVSNGRQLSARVTPTPDDSDWFEVRLQVSALPNAAPLRGDVQFHLHDTFADPDPIVPAVNGVAELIRLAWGAFTVGAETEGGATRLELNLAELPDAPETFKRR
jgi:hypothetical protein